MPAFQVQAGGTAVEQCDARGPHSLVFGPNDRSDGLQFLAPLVFTGGGAAPVTGGLGQFASLLLDSVARLSQAGAPNKFHQVDCDAPLLRRCLGPALGHCPSDSVPEGCCVPVLLLHWSTGRVCLSAARPACYRQPCPAGPVRDLRRGPRAHFCGYYDCTRQVRRCVTLGSPYCPSLPCDLGLTLDP